MMAVYRMVILSLALLLHSFAVESWSPATSCSLTCSKKSGLSLPLYAVPTADDTDSTLPSSKTNLLTRRLLAKSILASSTTAATIALATVTLVPSSSNALVKGNAPPPPKNKSNSSSNNGDIKKKCTNLEECQALAEQQADQERQEALAYATPTLVTSGGTRYRDFDTGETSSPAITANMQVKLFYKVLKIGKRSYDGLSGEGTVVFSCGYGLEDDEMKAGVKSFVTTVGSPFNIQALNEALIGMHIGGVRRFAVLPQKGWRKPGNACDGGPGGKGQGGDLKTDYVVVPTATMVAEEACFDQTKQPFPAAYAEQRRMAQRFDQSLIMEVQVVSAGPAESGL
jgi:FKBP-type peptidyl-prolyl cis-trans isomerase